jgi:hypothetical protein
MAKAISNPNLEPTSPIDVQFGVFELGNYRLPYMSCILSAEKCAQYLALAGDDPELTLASGTIEELFQRDIDEPRVHEIATRYLSPDVAKKPPFFNSITVALLPRGRGVNIPPRQTELDREQNPNTAEYGPARVSWAVDNPDDNGRPVPGQFGTLYWNKLGVKAVAIDGQHRLAAIKKLAETHPGEAGKLLVSTLILLFDKKFGLEAGDLSPISLMRQLFIDLNKHSQRVSRARQLLLDDLEPLSIALRTCIGNELDFQKTEREERGLPVGKAGEFDTRLPLELVDWHGEQRAKVDTGPYAISVLGLEWALLRLCKSKRFGVRLVDLSELAEHSDDNIGDYYDDIGNSLKSWSHEIPVIAEEIANAKDLGIPYTPSKGVVKKMGETVASVWGPALTCLLTTAAPYKKLADYRLKHSLFTANFGCWFQADQTARGVVGNDARVIRFNKVKDAIDEREPGTTNKFKGHITYINNNIKRVSVNGTTPEDHLLFSLTGQRALILTLARMFDVCAEEVANECRLADELKTNRPVGDTKGAVFLAQLLGDAVSYWDQQLTGLLFTKSAKCNKFKAMPTQIWRGSLLKRDSPTSIDFSGIAAERTSRTIHLLTAVWLYRKAKPKATVDGIKKWLKTGKIEHCADLNQSASGRQLKSAVLNFTGINDIGSSRNDKFPTLFLAKMPLGDEPTLDEQGIREFAASRIEWIWEHSRAK